LNFMPYTPTGNDLRALPFRQNHSITPPVQPSSRP
jgi:hypothetical protein